MACTCGCGSRPTRASPGTGECVHGGVQAIALIHELRPKLIGRDPFEIDAIFEDLRRRHVFDGGFAGALITALTGIEIALWDLKGKALNAPIYDLIGGKFRDKIRVYADCQVEPSMDFDEIKQVVDDVLERGFTALKIDVDIGAYTGDYRRGGGGAEGSLQLHRRPVGARAHGQARRDGDRPPPARTSTWPPMFIRAWM